MQAKNVEFRWNSSVKQLHAEDKLTGITIRNVHSGEEELLQTDGLFISIGRAPATEIFREQLALDPGGYIIADETTRTSLPGVFAAGDVRTKALRQIITAAADGAVAAFYTEEYLIKE
jgi:thioredoxin reductase (NADPH)